MPDITSSQDLSLLGLSLTINPDLKRDNSAFLLKFYEHAYKNRFLMKQEDKQILSRIFNEMQI